MVFTGDFNAKPLEDPIQILTNKNDSLHLFDTKLISEKPHYGPTGTFNGFQSKETSDEPIDYIFMQNGIKVLQHATLSQTWKGRFSSDLMDPSDNAVIVPTKYAGGRDRVCPVRCKKPNRN